LFSKLSYDQRTPNNLGFNYQLNSALFTNHARKYRYLYIPDGMSAIEYSKDNSFIFPQGSVLVKIFSLPSDTNIDSNETIIEVRLLINRKSGWTPLVYKWYSEFDDGYLLVGGKIISQTINHNNESQTFKYSIPSKGECIRCHKNIDENGRSYTSPIGLKARHLNKAITLNSVSTNQLYYWKTLGLLTGLPSDLNNIDTAPNWKDNTKDIQSRAKAYLDINCAHCHSDNGDAALSGLRLDYWRKDLDYSHGVCNPAHGWRGGGYDIWPGEGDTSSIPVRMRHTEAKDRMPPIGRSLVDEEAAQLISDWIDTLPYQACSGV